jgi:excisionase family DNA binding protein
MKGVEVAGLLTVDEAAHGLRLTPVSVRRRIKRGELRAVKLGKAPNAPLRIPESELARYVERSRTTV